MQPRTMVKAACVSDCITFRTVSREGKSPRELYVFRSLFDDLDIPLEDIFEDLLP